MVEERRVWVLPDEPMPVRLMNTIWADRRGAHDDLVTPDDLVAWLATVGSNPSPSRVTRSELAQAIRLRDALRRIAARRTGDHRVAAASAISDLDDALGAVNLAVGAAPTRRLTRRDDALRTDPVLTHPPVETALGIVATSAIELFTGEHAPTLRACFAPGCVLYFVKDHPRREWCSPACGNRARAARHYARHRGEHHSTSTE